LVFKNLEDLDDNEAIMTVELTIIGLGQIGTSFGLALAPHTAKITRTGSDIDPKITQQAKKLGAIDKIALNLNAAIRTADVLLLAIPLDQIEAMITSIGPELKPGVVLMDTAPLKAPVSEWMTAALPKECNYVGLTPVLNPKYLHSENFGIGAAHADLFTAGLLAITNPPGTNPKAISLAADLTDLVGAAPFFLDMYEIDGLMAATHFLPQFLSVALLNATVDQPGWQEARKVAGRAFAEVSGPAAHLDDVEVLSVAALASRDNFLRTLDNAIATLQSLRQDIETENNSGLVSRLKHAKAGVHQWWQERGGGNWLSEEMPKMDNVPTSKDVAGNIFGFRLRKKKRRQ
jgi:prephenate dehydrogenase